MSTARSNLLSRIQAIHTILSNPISIDTVPVPVSNSAAVAIRNGCTVMLFCALESFVRDRSLECANSINQSKIPYSHLSDDLKHVSIVSTFDGLSLATRGWSKIDKIQEFEKAAVAVSSGYLGAAYQFTSYSFARDKSNVTADDVGLIARAFGVENFWQCAAKVSAKAGLSIPTKHEDLFRLLARERHKAAHVSQHNVPHSWLQSALSHCISIAIAFDTLISTAIHNLNISGPSVGLKVTDSHIDFLTLKPQRNGKWAALRPSAIRASFVENDKATALARAMNYTYSRNLSVVCHDFGGRLTEWVTILG